MLRLKQSSAHSFSDAAVKLRGNFRHFKRSISSHRPRFKAANLGVITTTEHKAKRSVNNMNINILYGYHLDKSLQRKQKNN